MIELDLGRGDDGLVSVVGIRRHRKNFLLGQLGSAVPRFHCGLLRRVDRRQILANRIVFDFGVLERRPQLGRTIEKRQRANQVDDYDEGNVRSVGFGKAYWSNSGANEIVFVDGNGRSGDGNRRRLTSENQVAKIVQKNPMPGLKFAQECRSIFGGNIALGPCCRDFRHHPLPGGVYPDYIEKERCRGPISCADILLRNRAACMQ